MLYVQESFHNWQDHIHNLSQFFEILNQEYKESKVSHTASDDDLYDPLEAAYSDSLISPSHATTLQDDHYDDVDPLSMVDLDVNDDPTHITEYTHFIHYNQFGVPIQEGQTESYYRPHYIPTIPNLSSTIQQVHLDK